MARRGGFSFVLLEVDEVEGFGGFEEDEEEDEEESGGGRNRALNAPHVRNDVPAYGIIPANVTEKPR